MAQINIGITEKNRQAAAQALSRLLADEHILYNKTRSYHWNIKGPNFMELHKLYEDQYSEVADIIDEIAERIRTLGHYAEGRLYELLKLANLDEPPIPTTQKEQIPLLIEDHETIINGLRKTITELNDDYKDVGSSDFVTGLLKQHEKMSWMLRSYIGE